MRNQTPLSTQRTSLNRYFYVLLDREGKRVSSANLLLLSLVLLLCSIPQEALADSMTFTTDTTLTEDATIAAGETWTINNGITLTIAEDVTVTLEGDSSLLDNSGAINNSGTIINFNGSIQNSGIINNGCSGILEGTIPTSGNPVNDSCDPDMPEGFKVTKLGIGSFSPIVGNLIGFRVVEGNTDLNDDGDTDDEVAHAYDTGTGITTNLRLAGFSRGAGNSVILEVDESAQGNTDLNGDSDTEDFVVHVYDPSTGNITNLKLTGFSKGVGESMIVISVNESDQGNTDLNDDGDADDEVVHVYDPSTGITTNLKLAVPGSVFDLIVVGNSIILGVSESDQGNTDLNNDGDADDSVFHVYEVSTGITTNLKLALPGSVFDLKVVGNLVIIQVNESDQGNTDLNDDGDTEDSSIHVYDVSTGITTNLKLTGFPKVDGTLVVIDVNESKQGNTDLNDDGDSEDVVAHVYDASTGITTNLKLAGFSEVAGNLIVISVDESDQGNTDLNDDGDMEDDEVVHVYNASKGITTNLKLANFRLLRTRVAGNLVVISVDESEQGNTDLNDSGHISGIVVHVYDASTEITTNLKLVVVQISKIAVSKNLVVFNTYESRRSNTDLNGDGDTKDRIAQVYDATTGDTTNLKLALTNVEHQISGNLITFNVSEEGQGNTDLNDDGDTKDWIAHVYDASTGVSTNLELFGDLQIAGNLITITASEWFSGKTDLNADGDAADKVVLVYDAKTGMTTNLKLAVEEDPIVQESSILFEVSESRQGQIDLNNDGDTADRVLHIVRINETTPVFENVSDIIEQATGPDGATVEYPLPRVTDDMDPSPIVICEPTSGSQFALGVTKVTCIATDFDGNEAATSFTVRVVSEIDAPLTFTPIADATIKPDSPTENFGAMNKLNADINPGSDFLLKFDVSGIGMRRVQSATLRLFCTNKSDQGGEFHQADNDWSEDSVTWENAPLADREIVASLGPVVRLTWVEVDLTSLITEDGVYSLRVMSLSRDGVDYRSKEKPEFAPELVITFEDTLTFTPIADATIKRNSPAQNFGAVNAVRTGNRPVEDFLMKFDVSGIGTRTVKSATLRLFCTNRSDVGGEFHQTNNDWSEDTVTWDTAPLATREVVASLGPVARLTWVDVDLTSLITEDGVYSLRVMSSSDDGAVFRSKEKQGLEPELILSLE